LDFQHFVEIVALGRFVPFALAALFAFVDYDESARRGFYSHRPHHPAAAARAVARVYIHIARPKAFRAMVRVSVALHLRAAVAALKVFDVSLEGFHMANNTK
jgi:hypothetical protein